MKPCSFKLGTMTITPKRTGLRQPDMPAFLSKGSCQADTQPLAPMPGMDSPRLLAAPRPRAHEMLSPGTSAVTRLALSGRVRSRR